MSKTKFKKEVTKILNQGVLFEKSFVYVLRVNANSKFAVAKWPYYRSTCHGRYPVEEFEYDTADEALVKFQEIKNMRGITWSSCEKLLYED
jgi:hypothetical protein